MALLRRETQYKRQFGIWKWRKNVPTSTKAAMCDIIQTRAQLGKATKVKYKGQDLDSKKLRRFAKVKARQDKLKAAELSVVFKGIESLHGHALQCGNRM
jgi:hypothetical protein